MTTEHGNVISAILRQHPSAQTKRFGRALCKALAADDPEWEMPRPTIIPDAFMIDVAGKSVTTFEVEVTSWLGERQLANYAELWWALDDCEWHLEILTVDGSGVVTSRMDVESIALQRLRVEASRAIEPQSARRISETRALMEEFVRLNPDLARSR